MLFFYGFMKKEFSMIIFNILFGLLLYSWVSWFSFVVLHRLEEIMVGG